MRSMVDNAGAMPKCVFTDEDFHWQDDRPPRHPWSKTVIYETHLRGFTIHPSSGVEHPGTYRGLMEKLPYLKDLGVTAVELMPVQEFNETSVTRRTPHTNQPLRNYWGYDPVVFCAPKASYSSAGGVGPAAAGVQGNGLGLSHSRHRSKARCGVQSHGGRRRTGADALFPWDLDHSQAHPLQPRSSVILVARPPTSSRQRV